MKTREVIVLTPTTFDELKNAIAENYPGLSRQLQQIARFVLEYPEDMALETVAVIAKRATVQPSSMIRFARHSDSTVSATCNRFFARCW